MISNSKQQQQQSPPQQQQKPYNNCLFKFGKTKFISSLNNSTKTSLDSPKLLNSKMSSMTADLRSATAAGKAVKSTTMKPPMEAVVVNSIIYSKPSFCSIVVDLGCGGSITGEIPLAKEKMAKLPNGCCPNKQFTNEGFNPCTMGIKSSLTNFAAACLTGFTCPSAAATPPPPPPSSSLLAQTKDAQVYSLCTTINGSIHHQMSDLCDNLLAMAGFFNQAANHQHDNDDDSVIEFAYDDGDYEEDVIENEEDFDDDDEEEETDDDDDDIDCEYNHNLCDYGDDDDEDDDDDDDDYLPADKDIVDFSYKCLTENAPILNCDKRKKVRFNTKPTVHVMHTWNYAYRAARKGQWEMYARDRERFRLRVQRASLILNPILEREHRQKIFEKRFLNNVHHFDDQTQLHQQQQQPTVEVKSKVIQNAEKLDATTKEKKPESKNIYQKKKRKKRRRFCKMGNKHYF